MLNQVCITPNVNFKRNEQNIVTVDFNNNKRNQQLPTNQLENDMFMIQMNEMNDANKRQKSQEKWNKAGVLASCTIAASLLLMGLGSIAKLAALTGLRGKGGKSPEDAYSIAKVLWDDFKDKKNAVADLDSKTTSKPLREALNKIIDATGLSQKAKEWAGSANDKAEIMYLYGHGGTGKSYVAKQYAQKIGAIFTCVKYPDLGSPFKDAASMKISDLFDNIIKTANEHKDRKIVVCIDEIDAVMRKVNEQSTLAEETAKSRAAVLTGLDKIKEQCENVTVIATSNYHPKNGIVDPIALRRFNNKIEVPLGDEEQNIELLSMYLKNLGALKNTDITKKSEYKSFAKKLKSEGYSNGEIELIAKEAAKAFSASLKGVADSDLHKHPFKVKFLEDAKKMVGEASSKTNKLMDVEKAESKKHLNWRQRLAYFLFG